MWRAAAPLCAAVALCAFAPATAATGTLAGIVHIVARASAPLPSGAYPSRRVDKAPAESPEIANVIVYVQDAPAQPSLPPMHASIGQRDETFSPRVIAVTRGSTVAFPNFDPYFHDVFSLSKGATFDLGRYPKGQSRERRFTRAGIVKVFCNIHSQMSATIMVFDHRLFTIPSTDGTFRIEDVPTGDWHLSAWHERIGSLTKPVKVAAGETTRVEFTLPVADPGE